MKRFPVRVRLGAAGMGNQIDECIVPSRIVVRYPIADNVETVFGLELILFLAGFGHGSYLLLDLASAPFLALVRAASLSPGLQYGAFASPFQWGILAIILRRWKHGPAFAIVFQVLHYAVAGFALHFWLNPVDTDFAHLNGLLPGFTIYLVAGFIWYLSGQIMLWAIVFKRVSEMRRAQF